MKVISIRRFEPKELVQYRYDIKKISMKNQTVLFERHKPASCVI